MINDLKPNLRKKENQKKEATRVEKLQRITINQQKVFLIRCEMKNQILQQA